MDVNSKSSKAETDETVGHYSYGLMSSQLTSDSAPASGDDEAYFDY